MCDNTVIREKILFVGEREKQRSLPVLKLLRTQNESRYMSV